VPSILVVAADGARRSALVDALARRFRADYDVVARSTGDDVGPELGPLAVALAPIGTDDFTRLQRIDAAHPGAKRIAVVEVGDRSVADELAKAMTLGQVDYYVGHPWASPEEELYPVITEALRIWAYDQQLRLPKVTIVDKSIHGPGAALASLLEHNSVAAVRHLAHSPEGQALLDGPLAGLPLPALRFWDGRVLGAPTESEMVEALGVPTRPAGGTYDVAVVGAGPAGLAASVYASSEGLRTLTIEKGAVGGQAGTSSKIRNYLGFPWGVRGGDLAQQAHRQAEQLGAEIVATRSAIGLTADGDELLLRLSSGDVVHTRSVILTGGVSYRRTGVPSVDALIGRGVFYGAAAGEATSMSGLRVAVLGAGNSAGQAAAHLAAAGADVTVLVRKDSLGHSMSDYLVTQLEGTPTVTIRCQVEVAEALGDAALKALVLRPTSTGKTDVLPSDALFVYIGAVPFTDWLDGIVALDEHGFVVTGSGGADWLETSMPRVYAAGDIRAGSIKRVAAAVGEGSTAAMLARAALQEHPTNP